MKIGVMGPIDSIDKVLSLKEDMREDVELIPFKAHTLQESRNLILEVGGGVDGFLFTGRSVFDSVSSQIPEGTPCDFVPHNESSIFSLLTSTPLKGIENISIDVIQKEIVEESLKDSKIKGYYVLPHKDGYSEQDYIDFHEKNINENRAHAVFTTFSPIYDHFKRKGVPVYRLYTTSFSIRNTLSNLINEIKNSLIDRGKISVQLIRMLCDEKNTSKFEMLGRVLEFQNSLLPYLKTIQGAIFNNGWNEFIIFSTKGFISSSQAKDEFHKLLNKQKYRIYSGVGVGLTAAEAETNANSAMEYAQNTGKNCFYFMYEDKKVEGPIKAENCLVLNNKNTDERIDEISVMTGLSHSYIDKIFSIVSLYNINEFSADEMANYLGISHRSSRRIIKKLVDGGCAEIIGKESHGGSGRPQNIIKLTI